MHRRIVVFACTVDAAVVILLALAGVTLMVATRNGVSQAIERSEFAVGMLLGGVALLALMLAALFLVHGYWCWRRLQRLGPRHSPRCGEIAMLLLAPLIAVATAIAIFLRLLG